MPKFQVLFETAPLVETQLKRGHVGLGIHMAQHTPRTVIQAPLVVGRNLRIAGHFFCFIGSAGGRVLYFIERTREAVEVGDGFRMGRGQDTRARGHPVRRYHADRLRPRQSCA